MTTTPTGMLADGCEGCGEIDRPTKLYDCVFFEPDFDPEVCQYCAECAALARANFNGDTVSCSEVTA